jgi:Arc/MetJ-type ribon-helix-helix transcriptional regulator
MNQITVNVPDDVKDHLDNEIASGRHKSASDYICHLVEQEKKRHARRKIEAEVLEGLKSGPPEEITDTFWEEMSQRITAKSKTLGADT